MDLKANLKRVRARIANACLRASRAPTSVVLIAVTKNVDAATIQALIEAGVRHIAENRQQVATEKLPMVPGLNVKRRPMLHFIGPLQRNKVKRVLSRFDVIHSVDSLALAHEIGTQAAGLGRDIGVFVEFNVAGEEQKHGFEVAAAAEAMAEITKIPRLHVLGLMCMAPYSDNAESARPYFKALAALSRDLREGGHMPAGADRLSMGMSGDFEVAIEEGATHVRIGSALFE